MCFKLWEGMDFLGIMENGASRNPIPLPLFQCEGSDMPRQVNDGVQWNQNGECMHVDAWECRVMMSPVPDGAQDWMKTVVAESRLPHHLLGDHGHLAYLFVLPF